MSLRRLVFRAVVRPGNRSKQQCDALLEISKLMLPPSGIEDGGLQSRPSKVSKPIKMRHFPNIFLRPSTFPIMSEVGSRHKPRLHLTRRPEWPRDNAALRLVVVGDAYLGGCMRLGYWAYGFPIVALATLAGCGSGGGTSAPPVSAPTPTLAVTLAAASADVNVDEGQTNTFNIVANYTGTSTLPIVADVAVADKRYAVEGTPSVSGSSVTTSLRTIPFAPGGKSTSTVTVRLCTSAACTTVYPGSTATFTVNLDVRLKDWATFQRDPAHTGYVAVAYKTADFTSAWNTPGGLSPAYRQVAARRGNIFLNLRNASGRLVTRGLNAATGATVWEYDLGQKNYFSGPSYANGRVISAAMDLSSGNIPMDIIDADKGTYLRSLFYASQFATAGTPTPIGDDLFHAAGYFGDEVFGYNAAAGTRSWVQQSLGFTSQIGVVQEGESVAADANFVYYFSAGRLFTLSRTSGAVVNSIANPFFSSAGLSYFGTYYGGPILAGSGRVITFSDNRQSSQPLPLVAFSTITNAVLWRTNASYVGDPALRDGKLYRDQGEQRDCGHNRCYGWFGVGIDQSRRGQGQSGRQRHRDE